MHVLRDENLTPVLLIYWFWQGILTSAKSYLSRCLLFFIPQRFSIVLNFVIRSIYSNNYCKCSTHKRWRNSTLDMRSEWRFVTVHQMGKRWDHIEGWQSECGHHILEKWHHHTEPSSCSSHFRWQKGKVYLCCIQQERRNSTIVRNRR